MKEKIINYFFDEDERDLVPMYETLVKIGIASLLITLLLRLL